MFAAAQIGIARFSRCRKCILVFVDRKLALEKPIAAVKIDVAVSIE
jgi:hypothetical protein